MVVSKFGKKYTIVVPQGVREKTSIRKRDQIIWEVKGGALTPRNPLEDVEKGKAQA